jgi:hypothetical protein
MRPKDEIFSGYDEPTWMSIENIVRRIGVMPTSLRTQLEDLGRNCLRDARDIKDRRRGNSEARKQAEAIQRAITKSLKKGHSPDALGNLLQSVLEILSRKNEFFARVASQSRYNAQKPHLDRYFKGLLSIWHDLGGSAKGKLLVGFIQACAEPVVGTKSASERAIRKRLLKIKRNVAAEEGLHINTDEQLSVNSPLAARENVFFEMGRLIGAKLARQVFSLYVRY